MKPESLSIFQPTMLRRALLSALRKLHPASMVRNPVMFITEVCAAFTTLALFFASAGESRGFMVQITLWLWFTVVFANFAEAVAEGRGKAQADALRRTRTSTTARRLRPDGGREEVPAES